MRLLLSLSALTLLASFAPLSLFSEPPLPARSRIAFQPVPLEEGAAGRQQVGKLLYLGGWVLRSNDARFGGISAMHVEGREVLAASDAGWLFRFPLPGRTAADLQLQALPEGPGSPDRKGDRDMEAWAVHGRKAWIAFEGRNEVWRYERGRWRKESSAAPAAMKSWSYNGGTEAMLRLADGRFVVFSESKLRPDGSSEAVLFSGDPAEPGTSASSFGYAAPKGYKITDAALLPDGRMLLLHRRVGLANGISAKVGVADPQGVGERAIMRSVEIADLRPPLTVDNMEALSVTQEGGRTIVWIASDDNYLPVQRNLLMKFALVG
jgi:hypothetical protein